MKRNLISVLSTITLGAMLVLNGCAMTKQENRILLNTLDQEMSGTAITRSTAARVVAAPIIIPVGIAAGAVDMAVITPARAVRPAWEDTRSWIWDDSAGSQLRGVMLLGPKVVATPILFSTDWLCRSLFSTDFSTKRR